MKDNCIIISQFPNSCNIYDYNKTNLTVFNASLFLLETKYLKT